MTKQPTPPPERPFGNLSDEAVRNLENIGASLAEAEKDLDALEQLGMDTSRLRADIEFGKKARTIILERFGPRKS